MGKFEISKKINKLSHIFTLTITSKPVTRERGPDAGWSRPAIIGPGRPTTPRWEGVFPAPMGSDEEPRVAVGLVGLPGTVLTPSVWETEMSPREEAGSNPTPYCPDESEEAPVGATSEAMMTEREGCCGGFWGRASSTGFPLPETGRE